MFGAQWAPNHTPTPGCQRGALAGSELPRRAPPGQEPHPLRRGPEPAGPAPATRGRCRTVPGRLRCRADRPAADGQDGQSVGSGRAGPTYPFCCGALSAGGGAPKGRAVLLREELGAKVYRGGSVAGVMAWAETDPGRVRECGRPGPELRRGVLQPCSCTTG